MADVRVLGATLSGGRIERLKVGFHGLPARTVDRAQVLRWMKDGHSLVPVVGTRRHPALQLVEVGDVFAGEGELVVRTDTVAEAADLLPELPPA